MGLSPGEEDNFAAIVSHLARRRGGGIPWWFVVPSVVIVTIVVAMAVLLGLHHHFASLFYGTFALALATGLLLIVFVDRRDRPF